MAQLFAGTSGFAYPGWKPRFYPEKLPAKKFLEHYSHRLNEVEINYTFRRLAALSTLTAHGARLLSPAHDFLDGALRAAWVADPDGNPIQLVQRKG